MRAGWSTRRWKSEGSFSCSRRPAPLIDGHGLTVPSFFPHHTRTHTCSAAGGDKKMDVEDVVEVEAGEAEVPVEAQDEVEPEEEVSVYTHCGCWCWYVCVCLFGVGGEGGCGCCVVCTCVHVCTTLPSPEKQKQDTRPVTKGCVTHPANSPLPPPCKSHPIPTPR